MVKINGEDKDIAGKNLLEYLNEAAKKKLETHEALFG